jgi:hypothetical protein
MLEAVHFSDEDWNAFIRKAGRAHMLALRIPEALRDEARALVLPLAEADQSNLAGCAPAAAELQSFLLRQQFRVSSV